MARLTLALLMVAALVGAVALIGMGLRSLVRQGKQADRAIQEAPMEAEGLRRLAFFLLIALILYVAATGGNG